MKNWPQDWHKCPWPGCGQRVPRHLWGCKPHWYRLPRELRDHLWAAYRGDDLTEHAAALEAIDEYLAKGVAA